jgi:hypothetical protein
MDETLALEQLRERCSELGIAVLDALTEKADEVGSRAFLKCIPNHTLREEQIPEYLRLIGRDPSHGLVERVTIARRGRRLPDEEVMELEERQRLRCALCGLRLTRHSRPHVDHITPVALGGKSELANYQLLCAICNTGKSSLLAWVLGIPYESRVMTFRLRYCVLARANARCQEPGCAHSSSTSELSVTTRVPEHKGGAFMFDNLEALCSAHFRARQEGSRHQALNSLKLSRIGGLFQNLAIGE